MQKNLNEKMNEKDIQKGTTVRWFEIDENIHSSLLTYPNKEAFEKYIAKIEAYRKESFKTKALIILHKHEGIIKAENSN